MVNTSYKIIDGIKCYAPDLAFSNQGFNPESFEMLYRAEASNFWFISRNNVIASLVTTFGANHGDFLEIGCGTGFVLSGLKNKTGLDLHGAEIYIEGLRFAKQRLPDVDFFQLDALNIPFQDQFRHIGAFDVLEHIQEDASVMENVYKALIPGGKFFISVPQYPFMWSYLDEAACHKRRYTKNELRSKLKNAGFKVEYIGSFVFTLFPFMIISRLLNRNKNSTTMDEREMTRELRLPSSINSIFRGLLYVDEFLIRKKVSLPFGGSLIAVATKLEV